MAPFLLLYFGGALYMCVQDKITLLYILWIGHHAASNINCIAILLTDAGLCKILTIYRWYTQNNEHSHTGWGTKEHKTEF